MGLESSVALDSLIDTLVKRAINAAEVEARKYLTDKGAKLSSEEKRSAAIQIVFDELKKAGITNVTEKMVIARIESWLEEKGHEPGVISNEQEKPKSV